MLVVMVMVQVAMTVWVWRTAGFHTRRDWERQWRNIRTDHAGRRRTRQRRRLVGGAPGQLRARVGDDLVEVGRVR